MTDRAQAHTLESIVAGILILSSLVFALQVTAVTPLSASTASQHIENQQEISAQGVLTTAAEDGALKRAVLFWNNSSAEFHGADLNSYYTNTAPPNEFGDTLSAAFGSRGLAYNVYVIHEIPDRNSLARQRLVYRGAPSDNAVTASWTLTVFDSDVLYTEDEFESNMTVTDAENFYMEDVSGSVIYNVVRVEVVIWRM